MGCAFEPGRLHGEGFAGYRVSAAAIRRRRRGWGLQSRLLRDVRRRPCRALLWAGARVNPAETKTHRGLIAAFGEHLVKTARLTADLGKALNQVERIRLLADYTGEEVAADKARWAVAQAAAFVGTVQRTLAPRNPTPRMAPPN